MTRNIYGIFSRDFFCSFLSNQIC